MPEVPDIQVAPPEIVTIPDVEYVVASDEDLEKLYRVIIQNDDVTPMDFVVIVLRVYFALEIERAYEIMLEAHTNGRALVATMPFEEAQKTIYEAHSAARDAGFPLTFYMEPDE